MPALRPDFAHRSLQTLGSVALLLALAACGAPQESAMLYDSTRENTRQDAESHAMGDSSRASPQLQLGFGSTAPERTASAAAQSRAAHSGEAAAVNAEAAAVAAARPRALAEARTFLGTVPCPSGLACDASRFVVTLAPSGEWRARTTLLVGNEARQSLVDQGCWRVIGDSPLRIALTQPDGDTSKADLSFVNNNTLRVNSLNGTQPVLEHRLSRQADLDPIDELKDRPALAC